MKKIIFLLIVFLAFFHPSFSHAKKANTIFLSITNQEQTTSIYNQSSQIDFIRTDLLELTEDEISHFEKKFIATLKTAFKRDNYSFYFSESILFSRIKMTDIFINPYSSFQSFLSIYRI